MQSIIDLLAPLTSLSSWHAETQFNSSASQDLIQDLANHLWLNKYRVRVMEGYISKGMFLKDNVLKFYFLGNKVE